MNLKDQLQTMANGKNASYSAIADYLLARKSYAGLKLKEVAHACHVSDATVVRFCQNLGFDGFSNLKYNLTNVLQQKWRQFETDLHLCRENPVYFQRVEESCHVTEQLFTREKQEQFLSMLDEVKEIILIGLGTSYLVAKDFEIRFGRIGLRCRAIEDIILQEFAIKNTNADSLVIAFCYSGSTQAVMENLRLAREKKAKTILWTCDSNTHLEQDCDLTVYIHSSEPNHLRISTTSRIATLYLIDLIYFTYVNNKNLKLENYTDI